MQTVIETLAYLTAAEDAGMTAKQCADVVTLVAADPQHGEVMKGTGGCRKFRFAGRGKGKSGGFRIISFYSGADIPVFLLTVFGKDEKDNLTKAECNQLAALTKTLVVEYRSNLVRIGARKS